MVAATLTRSSAPRLRSARAILDFHGATHTGRWRTENEDSYLVDPESDLAVVCDGLGGRPEGALASDLAARAIVFHIAQRIELAEDKEALLRDAIEHANTAVLRAHRGDRSRVGMGTTAVAALAEEDGEHVLIGHVGDSRGYLWLDAEQRLVRLTRDHTLETLFAESGITDIPAARVGTLLTRVVGRVGTRASVTRVRVRPSDILMLCSDGLNGMLDDEEIAAVFADPEVDLEALPVALIEAANQAGGCDNTTIVVGQRAVQQPS